MRAPRLKMLHAAFPDLSRKNALLIRRIAMSEVCTIIRTIHICGALHAINEILGTYGVEALGPARGPSQSTPYEYLNAGDTYATTLIYNRKTDTLSVGSWGDIAERHPFWS